jgi:hypothetical protein
MRLLMNNQSEVAFTTAYTSLVGKHQNIMVPAERSFFVFESPLYDSATPTDNPVHVESRYWVPIFI